jgi:gamma-glutamyltranspeptidase
MIALANYNSWRRGDETLEMPSPEEIGATIDDAVNLLRKHDENERELARLRSEIEKLAYLSRNRTATRIELRDYISKVLHPNA